MASRIPCSPPSMACHDAAGRARVRRFDVRCAEQTSLHSRDGEQGSADGLFRIRLRDARDIGSAWPACRYANEIHMKKPRDMLAKVRILRALGPGITTGAADDDPSGIATYSVAGAQLGTTMLWTAWLTWPLMGCVQMMCARIGMVTGMGLAGALREKFPRWLVGTFALALLIANTINIAADLAGMGDAAEMLGVGPSQFYEALFGFGICFATVRLRYHQIAGVLKWLALALFAYVITAFVVK